MSLPAHCSPVSPFLESVSIYLSTCLPTPGAFISYACGLLSIVAWLFAQLPQIIKNHQRKSVDGLSLGFLAIWLAGDIGNMLGALWTRQMWFQQVVGGYYVFVDIILVSQWMWFHGRNQTEVTEIVDGVSVSSESDDADIDENKKRYRRAGGRRGNGGRSLTASMIVVVSMLFHLAGASPTSSSTLTLPGDAPSEWDYELFGRYLSWMSTFCYLLSRMPQLLLNFRRRSTSGLAITLFVAAFFGNVFYSASLIFNPLGHADYPPYGGGGVAGPEGSEWKEWWGRSLPFFLGAAGVLMMDFAVFLQWVFWGEGDEEEEKLTAQQPQVQGWWPWSGWWKGEADREVEDSLLQAESSGQRSDRGYGTL